jgi:Uri superfamily endonuclease
MVEKGAYCLCIFIEDNLNVRIGALGLLPFERGRYIYVGSALNGLFARVKRHIRTSKGLFNSIHWHIDYLLKEKDVRCEAVYLLFSEERIECDLARKIGSKVNTIKRFGCSDCKCKSHLFRVDDWEFLTELGMEKWELDFDKQVY